MSLRCKRGQLFPGELDNLLLVKFDLELPRLEETTLVVGHQDGQLDFHLSLYFFKAVVVVDDALSITLPILARLEYFIDLGFSRPQFDFVVTADQ